MVSALFSLPLPDLKLLIVDDNSPDGTGDLADELKRETGRVDIIHRQGKMGLGTAYLAGFKKAIADGADLVGQMDCDFSHPPEKLLELRDAIESGANLALGSRYINGGSLDDQWPFWRKALSSFGNFYSRTILNLPVRDVTGGFRVWQRDLLTRMPLSEIRSTGYVFQVEMLYVASRLGSQIKEIPFHFADRRFGQSKMSFRIQVEAAVNVWRLLGMHQNIK